MKLNEKLAQMDSVTKAATPGPWHNTWGDDWVGHGLRGPPSRDHYADDQIIVRSEARDPLTSESETAHMVVGMIWYDGENVAACSDANAEHIATFHPGVAAALVAVAKEASEQPECPFCRLPRGVHYMGPPNASGNVPCPLGKLTAALGLDRGE